MLTNRMATCEFSKNVHNVNMEHNFEICRKLSKEVYNNKLPLEIDGWKLCEKKDLQVINIKTENNVTKSFNLACASYKKGKEIVLAFRGTNDALDFLTDSHFLIKRLPPSMVKATNMFKRLRRNYADFKITVTGHSLGGAYAQVITGRAIKDGDDNCNAITFNAPGMGYALTKKEKEKYREKLIKNISNYIVMNDYIGNFREHLGASYYAPPYPLNLPHPEKPKAFETPHGCIINCIEETYEMCISCPEGWNSELAWALWSFDETSTTGPESKLRNTFKLRVREKHLKKAVDIIKNLQKNKGFKLLGDFKFKSGKFSCELARA